MTARTEKFTGLAGITLANLLWAGGYPATAIALQQVSPTMLTLIRLGTGALVLVPFLRLETRQKWTGRSLVIAIVLGIVGFAAPVYLSTLGLADSSSSLAAISIALEPLFTILIASIAFRKPLSIWEWTAMFTGFGGAWVIAGCPRPGNPGYWLGGLLLILAVACFAIYNVFGAYLAARTSATSATSSTLFFGFLAMLPFAWFTPLPPITHLHGSVIFATLYTALGETALAYLMWVILLQKVPVSSAALSLYLQPVFGVIFSILIVHNRPSLTFYAGSALILTAIGLASRASSRRGAA